MFTIKKVALWALTLGAIFTSFGYCAEDQTTLKYPLNYSDFEYSPRLRSNYSYGSSLTVYYDFLQMYGAWRSVTNKWVDTVSDQKLDEIFNYAKTAFSDRPSTDYLRFTTKTTFPKRSGKSRADTTEIASCDLALEKSGSSQLEYLFRLLQLQDRIIPLNSQTRDQMGGLWAEPRAQKNKHIPAHALYGGHECSSKMLFLEDGLRPANSSALIAHELQHLYFNSAHPTTSIPLRSLVFLDELLGYSIGGLLQLKWRFGNKSLTMAQKINGTLTWVQPGAAFYRMKGKLSNSRSPYQPESDLTMYNRNSEGNLRNLFLKNNRSLCGTMKYILDQLGKGQSRDTDIQGLSKAIAIGNFANDESETHLQNLQGQVGWTKTPTLFRWLAQTSELPKDFEAQARALVGPTTPSSRYCQMFVSEVGQKELQGYIGLSAKTNGGGSGVKVEVKSIQACQGIGF